MLRNNLRMKEQKGFTAVGWVVVITIFLFFAYLAIILTPYVISNHSMNRILESLKEEPGITQKSKREIWRLIENRLTVNQVKGVSRDNFYIEKDGNDRIMVYLDYEDRITFVKDVYIVIVRKKDVELIRN